MCQSLKIKTETQSVTIPSWHIHQIPSNRCMHTEIDDEEGADRHQDNVGMGYARSEAAISFTKLIYDGQMCALSPSAFSAAKNG